MRLRQDLRDWADRYAEQRKSSRTAVVEAALEHFAELAATGVPDLPVPREQGAGSRVGRAPRTPGDGVRRPGPAPEAGAPPAGSVPAAGSRPTPADVVLRGGGRNDSEWQRQALLRQERLNARRGKR